MTVDDDAVNAEAADASAAEADVHVKALLNTHEFVTNH